MLAGDRLAGDVIAAAGLQVHTFNGLLLREPWEVQVDMSRWGQGSTGVGLRVLFCMWQSRLVPARVCALSQHLLDAF